MNHCRFDDNERSYRMRARSQPRMFERESAERFRPYERTYARDEKRRMENERFNYHSEPEVSFSDRPGDIPGIAEYSGIDTGMPRYQRIHYGIIPKRADPSIYEVLVF